MPDMLNVNVSVWGFVMAFALARQGEGGGGGLDGDPLWADGDHVVYRHQTVVGGSIIERTGVILGEAFPATNGLEWAYQLTIDLDGATIAELTETRILREFGDLGEALWQNGDAVQYRVDPLTGGSGEIVSDAFPATNGTEWAYQLMTSPGVILPEITQSRIIGLA